MSEELIIGLRIGAIGLGVTFIALGLLGGVMRGLLRLFPTEKVVKTVPAAAPLEVEDEQRLEEMAVALAVGICLLEREGALDQQDPNLGQLLENK